MVPVAVPSAIRAPEAFSSHTWKRDTYSLAAGEVILPHVLGVLFRLLPFHTSWPSIIEHTDVLVAFGGLPVKNGQINNGGSGRHVQRDYMREAADAGVALVNVSPLRSDIAPELGAQWIAPRPNIDVALMLGLAHTLYTEGLHDEAFVAKYTVGFERFVPYLTGAADGVAKDAQWAASITGIDAQTIRTLARRMAAGRTMISLAWSLTRQDHGEQPFWMGVDAGGDARPDRTSGRRRGLRLLGDQRGGESHRTHPGHRAAAGPQRGRGLHSRGPHLRSAAQPRRRV